MDSMSFDGFDVGSANSQPTPVLGLVRTQQAADAENTSPNRLHALCQKAIPLDVMSRGNLELHELGRLCTVSRAWYAVKKDVCISDINMIYDHASYDGNINVVLDKMRAALWSMSGESRPLLCI